MTNTLRTIPVVSLSLCLGPRPFPVGSQVFKIQGFLMGTSVQNGETYLTECLGKNYNYCTKGSKEKEVPDAS